MGLVIDLIDAAVIEQEGDDCRFSVDLRRMLPVIASQNPQAADFRLGQNVNQVPGESMGLYSNLHALRGFAAHIEMEGVEPDLAAKLGGYKALRQMYDTSRSQKFEHLIEHSDCDGYYLPVEFSTPIELQGQEAGQSVGSCQALLQELNSLTEALFGAGISQFRGPEVLWTIDPRDPFATEKFVWTRLRWLLRNAIRYQLLMCF